MHDNILRAETFDFPYPREEPDGGESDSQSLGAGASSYKGLGRPTAIKVPEWGVADHSLNVEFNRKVETQILEMNIEAFLHFD